MKTPKSKDVKRFFFIAFCIFLFWCIIFACRYWYLSTHPDANQDTASEKEMAKIIIEGDSISFSKFWKYHNGDDSLWASPAFDDSKWDTINPELNLDSIPENKFNGFCWFRTTIQIDSLLINKVLGIKVSHFGASEFFLDGKLLQRFGIVSANKNAEEKYLPRYSPVLFTVNAKGSHLLAIRYSNHSFQKHHSMFNEEIAGISLAFLPHPEEFISAPENISPFIFSVTLLFGFFITLCIVHFLLFLFYRQQKQNLYYSLFAFLFSLSFLALYIALNTNNPVLFLFVNHYAIAGVHLLLLSLIRLLHVLFKPSGAQTTFPIAVFLAFLPLAIIFFRLTFISDIISLGTLVSIYIIFALIEFIRSVIQALIEKKSGAKIIGTGVLFFALFILSLILIGLVTGKLNLQIRQDTAIIFIVLLLASIVSIPLSMSIYLAYDFSQTNRTLSRKLHEVEELSKKSITQEKEKQEILSRQKENLEIQVTERTRQVVEQKKVIEEKNKDITDSINYAKRIQDAILPSEEQIKKMLPESFVLFKPKDIVSGDFY
ncbi:MAG TPA: hypothetical protein VJ208_02570, partial [Candidatus Nanoarchaeia archaeon]|nr:hypothetical protein [Candidatus Nanoarchaeia archaeon]